MKDLMTYGDNSMIDLLSDTSNVNICESSGRFYQRTSKTRYRP